MTDQEKAERVVALVEEMRNNTREMRSYKNIPLARECVSLLQAITDPEETPLGKALAIEAIVDELSEYDTPRFVLSILRYELQLMEANTEPLDEDDPSPQSVAEHIQRLEEYIDTEHVSMEAFDARYPRYIKHDPVERTEQCEEVYYEVEQEIEEQLSDTPRGMGFCFAYWSARRAALAKRGIEWYSPATLNPRVMFD